MPTTLTRSLLTVLVPGIVAVAPWLLALVQHTQATLGFASYPSLAHTVLFAAVAVAGTILQGIGSFIEVAWDKKLEASHDVKNNWYAYLSRSFESEPVGYRYISRLVTTMYFELSMLLAVPVFIGGAALLSILRFPHLAWLVIAVAVVSLVLTVAYFWWQARCTHEALCETRKQLNARVGARQL